MFDYVRCGHPLPDGWGGPAVPDDLELQTKDFGCDMTTIWLRADGRLLVEDFEYEVVPKDERPHPDADGLLGMAGSLRKINRRWRDLNHHGDVRFYGLEVVGREPPDERGWRAPIYKRHDYVARFTHGQLEWLRCDSEEAENES